jgi:hypothetical protein
LSKLTNFTDEELVIEYKEIFDEVVEIVEE